MLDGDGQFPPSVFHDLDAELESGSGLVLGDRKVRVGGAMRVVASYTYLLLCRLIIGFDLREINAGARAISREFAEAVAIKHLGMMVNPELYATAKSLGFTITEVSVGHEQRIGGGTSNLFGKPFLLVRQAIEYFRFLRLNYQPLGGPPLTPRR